MQLHRISELGLALRVNGISIPEVGLRVQRDRLGERDLVVVHQPLGMFAVDDRFLLELKTAEDKQWKTVRVAEVKRAICSRLPEIDLSSLPNSSERVERALLEDVPGSAANAKNYQGRFVPSSDPLIRALQVLYESAIPAIPDEPRTDASDGSQVMVVRVPLVLKSRIRLRRAGFHQDPRWRGIVIHPETGHRIELVEWACVERPQV
jgi:hypothetical protein